MTTSYIQIEDDAQKLYEAFDKAYKTKIGEEIRHSRTHKFVSQHKFMRHQVFTPGSWLVDLVKFGDYWYVFFVEANTRYLIVIQGNSDFLTPSAIEVNTNKRVPTDIFLEVFKRFEEMNGKPVTNLIGDSEKAFWSKLMMEYYQEKNIAVEINNVSKQGHIRMSILDRIVRTMRDICYNMHLEKNVAPNEMIQAVVVYNDTTHHTFRKMLNKDLTPKMLHENPDYEKQFIQALKLDNIHISSQRGFHIPVGIKVVAFDELAPLEKRKRSKVLEGDYVVEQFNLDGTYKLKNNDDGSILASVPRRNLRAIY